jgi:hypothetical protein
MLHSVRKKPPAASKPRRLVVSQWAHDEALHYLARRDEYGFADDIRKQLTEVVNGYTGRCDEAAVRAGIEWMRQQERRRSETPRSFEVRWCPLPPASFRLRGQARRSKEPKGDQ